MNEYMKKAIEVAEENLNNNAGGPFGACIIKDGKVKSFSGARLFAAPEALKGSFDGRLNDIWLVINCIYIFILTKHLLIINK